MSNLSIADAAASNVVETAVTLERFRSDIQALRGYAILLVLLHHSHLIPFLKAGYLGVDVFFVVSGYLITGIVQRSLQAGTFSFKAFYLRRAKRLLPAAYATFAGTIALSFLFLTQQEMNDFAWQLFGAVTFTGNIFLWTQTGYFEGAANLKPLLHAWSLSIEEQYYLFLPAALVFTPKRYWKISALIITVLSLALCLAFVSIKPGAVFYLLPTRAWELALGSFGILALDHLKKSDWIRLLFWPAMFAMLGLPFFPTGALHPGPDALIICVATLIVILRQHTLFNSKWPMSGLVWLGDISYSLYLVHWPLFAFAANAWVAPVPGIIRLALLVLAITLAWAIYNRIEKPMRKMEIVFNKALILKIISTSLLLIASTFGINFIVNAKTKVDFQKIREPNFGLSEVCEFGERFEIKQRCSTSKSPEIMVWGDSFAMHLVDGIEASTSKSLVQATKSNCGPFLDLSMFRLDDAYNRKWAEGCIRFNESVVDYLSVTPTIDVVVLASPFTQYMNGSNLLVGRSGVAVPITNLDEDSADAIILHALAETVKTIRAMHKRVVLVAPPPSSEFDIGRCLELKVNGKPYFGSDTPSCEISEVMYRKVRQPVFHILANASINSDIQVIHFDSTLCNGDKCSVEIDGIYLYGNGAHLSHQGSRKLGLEMKLADQLWKVAR